MTRSKTIRTAINWAVTAAVIVGGAGLVWLFVALHT